MSGQLYIQLKKKITPKCTTRGRGSGEIDSESNVPGGTESHVSRET